MTSASPRIAVLGAGTMGVMTAWRLAERGFAVTAIDDREPGHSHGAAGGESRIFRVAYKEGRHYVPLLRRSRVLWQDLERDSGERLLLPTGALTIGAPDHPDVAETLAAARTHALDVDVLDEEAAARRFAPHRLLDGEVIVVDKAGGTLLPSAALRAAAGRARARGAELRIGERVLDLKPRTDGIGVVTASGTTTFDAVVSALGPWSRRFWDLLAPGIEVRRVVLAWLAARNPGDFRPEAFPPGVRRSGPGGDFSFFSSLDDRTVKMNLHIARTVLEELDDPLVHDVEAAYAEQVAATARRYLPGLETADIRMRAYFDGYTPDGHGLFGPHPDDPRIVLMAGFSGHGFKLSPLFGDIAADLATTGETAYDIAGLDPARFRKGAVA